MNYDDAVAELVRAGSEAGIPVTVEPTAGDEEFYQKVFGEQSQSIDAIGYPTETEIPWVVEELYLYSLRDIEERQAEYRYDAKTGQASAAWDDGRYVVAEWAANPVSIDASRTISYSRHGDGSWTYTPFAADLPQFLTILARWLQYFVVARNSNLFDENFEINAATRKEISRVVLRDLDPKHQAAAINFLLGEI